MVGFPHYWCAHYNRFLPPTFQPDCASLDGITVVLVAPRNPLNIGAAARAMANFGFSRLTVVAPYEPHWREARSAVDAEHLLASAVVKETLSEAVADCSLVLGTASLTNRQPEQPVVSLPQLAPLIAETIAKPEARIAIVFGPEKRGLTRDDLALCHRLLTIPTSAAQPSMNLGQAVAVCLYEIATRFAPQEISLPASGRSAVEDAPATSGQLDQLTELVDQAMEAADYSPAIMRVANQHDTQLVLRRLSLSQRDIRRILGLFRRILHRIRR